MAAKKKTLSEETQREFNRLCRTRGPLRGAEAVEAMRTRRDPLWHEARANVLRRRAAR
ncbi:MAG: hypothetical protein ACHREM_28770 [Polyangiales bacterium]